ncbi:cobyric acid synthase [Bradyrhizobium sp. ORS 278]|uniref:Cobyric acid synthase n=1 Tax=Bradyrhizobium sp. (strain ORS 278) TaxID=114615 RepID=COBQ_BRASO|nr:cobyric acid synthase [Bradyrhizobium sp. ORS 278]A4YXJ9.1 RecName: Full=Cobyric acid synthase [Bradyrhizobium sp. ORS 278]CAL78625.1 cobyric acid synthase [Bradyrhizobium sp. ORS 278]
MAARAIMFQGTGSDVGKSLMVAGLARALTLRGLTVAPFKPQNMSNNAAVTADGGEIGRAQALQARAARRPMTVHMNPVLLKPQSEVGSQVVVQGRVIGNAKASAYQAMKPQLMAAVLESFHRLAADADIVLVEGAGSASEINLRAGDIANMGFAQATQTPVVIIGDIDRGGVIASLVGTKAVLAPDDAALVAGFLVNRFRGDPALFAAGMNEIAARTGWASLGLIPHFSDARRLPAEDALGLPGHGAAGGQRPKVVVLAYPRISNFDEFDPLRLEDGIDLQFLRPGTPIPGDAAVAILPGSKATIADLQALRETGWDIDLSAHLRRGGRVLGICGGYQMLGRKISDPDGHEGAPGSVAGLGLLDVETTLTDDKALREVHGALTEDQIPFRGYEMHIGRTDGPTARAPFLTFADGRSDGAVAREGQIAGCYVHGLFADDGLRAHWLGRLGAVTTGLAYESDVEATLDGLAAHLERHVNVSGILALARRPTPRPTAP